MESSKIVTRQSSGAKCPRKREYMYDNVLDTESQPKTRKSRKQNSSGVNGVCFLSKRNGWLAHWYEGGVQRKKFFSSGRFGDTLAREMACQFRAAQEVRFNNGYKNHFLQQASPRVPIRPLQFFLDSVPRQQLLAKPESPMRLPDSPFIRIRSPPRKKNISELDHFASEHNPTMDLVGLVLRNGREKLMPLTPKYSQIVVRHDHDLVFSSPDKLQRFINSEATFTPSGPISPIDPLLEEMVLRLAIQVNREENRPVTSLLALVLDKEAWHAVLRDAEIQLYNAVSRWKKMEEKFSELRNEKHKKFALTLVHYLGGCTEHCLAKLADRINEWQSEKKWSLPWSVTEVVEALGITWIEEANAWSPDENNNSIYRVDLLGPQAFRRAVERRIEAEITKNNRRERLRRMMIRQTNKIPPRSKGLVGVVASKLCPILMLDRLRALIKPAEKEPSQIRSPIPTSHSRSTPPELPRASFPLPSPMFMNHSPPHLPQLLPIRSRPQPFTNSPAPPDLPMYFPQAFAERPQNPPSRSPKAWNVNARTRDSNLGSSRLVELVSSRLVELVSSSSRPEKEGKTKRKPQCQPKRKFQEL